MHHSWLIFLRQSIPLLQIFGGGCRLTHRMDVSEDLVLLTGYDQNRPVRNGEDSVCFILRYVQSVDPFSKLPYVNSLTSHLVATLHYFQQAKANGRELFQSTMPCIFVLLTRTRAHVVFSRCPACSLAPSLKFLPQ